MLDLTMVLSMILNCAMQSLIQEKLDHQVKLHVDHIKLQNNITELSEQIIAASEVRMIWKKFELVFVTHFNRPFNQVKRLGWQLKSGAMSSM
jgi:hypothetical protein